jgi:acetyl esterase/lipase
MAAAYESWEKANPGVDPRSGTGSAATASTPTAVASTQPPSTGRTVTSGGGKVEKDVTYCTGGATAVKMDIYYPKNATGTTPAVLYVHGGGWTSGSKSAGAGAESIPELLSRGYLVAAIDYRLAPQNKWPAQIEDAKCAVRYLRANAAKYNIDPNRIGAMGGSAGGHLVSMLGVTDGHEGFEGKGGYAGVSSRVEAVVDMFGPSDLTVDFSGAGQQIMTNVFNVSSRPSDVLKNASPVTWVSADDPAFLILQGEKDALVPPSQSQEFYDALKKAGVDARLVMVKNAGHGFAPEGGQISPSRAEITKMIADFFDAKLK